MNPATTLTRVFRGFTFIACLSALAAGAQTNAPAPAQVILLGTLHGSHRTSTNYSMDVLRQIIVRCKPAAILVEQPPDRGGQPTVRDGRICEPGGSVENVIANAAAEDLGIDLIAYDRESRDEFYQSNRYFARQQAANQRLDEWLAAQQTNKPDSIATLANRLQSDAVGRQAKLSSQGPNVINSPAYDVVIAAKHSLMFGVRPKLLLAAGERELAEEIMFLADEWQERNGIMARHIREAARAFPGKRLVVLNGSEHRYLLRELLAKAPEVQLSEFYEVAGWTNAQPNGSTAAPKGTDKPKPAEPNYRLVGIGVELQSGYPEIKRVFPGSPAESCGELQPGDRVLGVAQGERPFVDARNLGLPELVQTIRGKPGTTIRLQVRPAEAALGSNAKTVTLTRAEYVTSAR